MTAARNFARLRRRLGRAAWRAALGPTGGSIPGQYVRSIVEKAGTWPIAAHIENIELLEPAHVDHYELGTELPGEFRRSKAFDDRYVYRLRDVCVSPRTGLCWLSQGGILEESYGSLIRLLGWGATALDEPLVGPRRTIPGPIIVLPGGGYFHWLLEALPAALHALEREPDATLLVPREAPRFLLEALDFLGAEAVVRSDDPVLVEELVLTAHAPFSGFVPREDVLALRAAFRPSEVRSLGPALYVSRRLNTRHPANEALVEEALANLGFRILLAEELTFSEQIEAFLAAPLIAGAHGAGLANLVWATEVPVLEVFLAGHFNDCYARLCATIGGEYRPFYARGDKSTWGLAPLDLLVETAERLLMPKPLRHRRAESVESRLS